MRPPSGDAVWEHYALDWRKLAAEGVFDGIWVMSFPIDKKRPFESTEEFYDYMIGKTIPQIANSLLSGFVGYGTMGLMYGIY